MADRLRVMTLFGTRPDAVKMAPVVRRLAAMDWVEPVVAVTGQHREMLDQVLDVFAIRPNLDLGAMRPGQRLAELTARMLEASARALRQVRPDLLLVQGDTATAFAGALAAFYERIPVGHVEAGLRSFERYDPFPEEGSRRLLTVMAELHFAPTRRNRENLLAEGVPAPRVHVTGNTVVDALMSVAGSSRLDSVPPVPGVGGGRRTLLVTLHRREHWGLPMEAMCGALRRVLNAFSDVAMLFPMHRNPVVRATVSGVLGGHPRAILVEPLDYLTMVKAMACCHMVVTDSGGLQEEAPALGKPVLVLRETTERPEAIEAGTARLVGTDPVRIAAQVGELLTDEAAYRAMAHAVSPFGDGHAAERIADHIGAWAMATGRLTRADGPVV